MGKETRHKLFANQFKCDFADQVTSISSIGFRFPAVRNTDGGNAGHVDYNPGQPDYGSVTITGPANKEAVDKLKDLAKKHSDGDDARTQITVELWNPQDGTVARTFNLIDCIPERISLPAADLDVDGALTATWSVTFNVTRVDLRATKGAAGAQAA